MAPEYTVEQLSTLDRAALVEYIKANRDGGEAVDITNIKDWDEVPESRQTELLQKLIEAYPLAKEPQLSGALLHRLLAKLDSIRSKREALPDSPPASTRPEARLPSLSPQPGAGKEHQIRCYHELVGDGGRPPCSLETLDGIYQSPASFAELLGPWLEKPTFADPDDLGVFSRPLARWKEFRRWQRDNRGGDAGADTADESLAAFREEKRRYFESAGLGAITTTPDFDETIRKMWQQEEATGRPKGAREVENGSLAEYVRAARRRLAKHGFHEAFRLLKDPRRQGERATWIEFLEFECWRLDADASIVRRHQPSRDAAWEALLESGLLRAGETEEDLLATPPAGVHDRQGGSPRDVAIRRFMRQTKAYRDAKAVESRQSLRVQWALSQMPPKPAAAKPAGKTGKRRRHHEEDGEAPDESVEQEQSPVAKKKRTEPEPDGGATRRKKPRQRDTASMTRGPLRLAGPAWEFKGGKRRSTRIEDAEEAARGVRKPPGTLRGKPCA